MDCTCKGYSRSGWLQGKKKVKKRFLFILLQVFLAVEVLYNLALSAVFSCIWACIAQNVVSLVPCKQGLPIIDVIWVQPEGRVRTIPSVSRVCITQNWHERLWVCLTIKRNGFDESHGLSERCILMADLLYITSHQQWDS